MGSILLLDPVFNDLTLNPNSDNFFDSSFQNFCQARCSDIIIEVSVDKHLLFSSDKLRNSVISKGEPCTSL